ncbi:hypothetical protein QL093DRAFT_2581139 [Fusarium oxysporum]|nr:hypothetical protein QL093DRAFT_2581139 [Fusarium oxysporum]
MSSDSQATALDSDHSSECTLAYVLFLSEFSCFRYVKNVRPLTRPGRDKRRGRVSSSAERQGLSARGKSLHSQGIKKLNPIAAVERPKGLRKGDRHRVEKTPQKRLRLWMRVSEEYAGVSHVESLREISQSSPGLSRCQTCTTEIPTGQDIAEKKYSAVIGYRHRYPCQLAVRGTSCDSCAQAAWTKGETCWSWGELFKAPPVPWGTLGVDVSGSLEFGLTASRLGGENGIGCDKTRY